MTTIPDHILKRLRDGEPDWHPVKVVTSVAMSYVQHGLTFEQFHRDTVNEANQAGHVVRCRGRRGHKGERSVPRPEAEAERTARRIWGRALDLCAETSPVADRYSILARIAELEMAAHSDPRRWKGVGGTTERQVLHDLYSVARLAFTLAPGRSTREASRATGRSQNACSAAYRRLIAKGAILRLVPARGTNAAQYQLCEMPFVTRSLETTHVPMRIGTTLSRGHEEPVSTRSLGTKGPYGGACTSERVTHTYGSDLFTYAALGGVAGTVYVLLLGTTAGTPTNTTTTTVEALSVDTGYRLPTVAGHLRRLADVGLAVEHADDLWSAVPANRDDLDRLCAEHYPHAVGTGTLRGIQYASQRDAFVTAQHSRMVDATTGEINPVRVRPVPRKGRKRGQCLNCWRPLYFLPGDRAWFVDGLGPFHPGCPPVVRTLCGEPTTRYVRLDDRATADECLVEPARQDELWPSHAHEWEER